MSIGGVVCDEEKRMICAQMRVPGGSGSRVSRRHDVNAKHVFNRLKEPCFADVEPREPKCWATTEPAFLSSEATESRDIPVLSDSTEPGTLEIDLCSGHRLLVTGAYDADSLVQMFWGLLP